MADVETAYHRRWLGMAEPVEGLVVSVPVLVEAACMQRLGPELSRRLADDDAAESDRLTVPAGKLADGRARRRTTSLARFLEAVLDLGPDLFDGGDRPLPKDLELFVPEGRETLRATLALKKRGADDAAGAPAEELTPAAKAGRPYVMLVHEVMGVALDQPDTREGVWAYPPIAKFERLLRACRVPIGLLTNGEEFRLVYAPHGESTGILTFRVADLAAVGGRDLLDAFVMLLSRRRFFGVAREHQLPAILAESRRRQADVTTQLADQVQEALAILLRGFQAAADRDGARLLEEPLTRAGGDFVYKGLLTVLLRLVFLLYAEDRELLPTKDAPYGEDLSLLALFGQLQRDRAVFPDTMARRFGAWPRLLALFRAVYAGATWRTDGGRAVTMPPRRGELFDPARYPFLEGWGPDGGAPEELRDRARMRVPAIDDGTVFEVLERLLVLKGQRLSYRALDVEQIGSIYEGLLGFSVQRLASPAVCVRPDRAWIAARTVREQPPARRAAWLEETAGLAKAAAQKIAAEIGKAKTDDAVLALLDAHRAKGTERAPAGTYVLQPGPERRRTSAHYTPPSLTGPIVRKTLAPLLRAMGDAPRAKDLLDLKICDPAMGSGAFLVEACRYLADQPGLDPSAVDAYLTLVGYFNSLRELGGMRRLLEDEIRSRLGKDEHERAPLDAQGSPHPWARRREIKYEPVELTSRESTASIAAAKDKLAKSHPCDDQVDVALASNMISVGLDIDRLGLMVIAGQPKTASEYIQASSRVGRNVKRPGVVVTVTVYNMFKARDRSHYERFGAYHESFYRHVEAGSVTPFSAPALERGLAGLLVMMTRLSRDGLTPPEAVTLTREMRQDAEIAVGLIADKAAFEKRGRSEAAAERVRAEIAALGKTVLEAWASAVATDAEERVTVYSGLEPVKGEALLFTAIDENRPHASLPRAKFCAPTSMRDVEPSVHLWKSRTLVRPDEEGEDGQ